MDVRQKLDVGDQILPATLGLKQWEANGKAPELLRRVSIQLQTLYVQRTITGA